MAQQQPTTGPTGHTFVPATVVVVSQQQNNNNRRTKPRAKFDVCNFDRFSELVAQKTLGFSSPGDALFGEKLLRCHFRTYPVSMRVCQIGSV